MYPFDTQRCNIDKNDLDLLRPKRGAPVKKHSSVSIEVDSRNISMDLDLLKKEMEGRLPAITNFPAGDRVSANAYALT